jgi:hypothetical protein
MAGAFGILAVSHHTEARATVRANERRNSGAAGDRIRRQRATVRALLFSATIAIRQRSDVASRSDVTG